MYHVTFKMATLVLLVLGIETGQVRADKAQLEERLNQELSIQFENATISKVF